jgi:hypothetical protein
MSSHLESLRERRLAIIASCDADRMAVADSFGEIQHELRIADRVVSAAQRFSRNKVLVGVLAVGLVAAPILARKWIRRAAWWLPVIIQGYRTIRSASR